jgi:hypothetical protein
MPKSGVMDGEDGTRDRKHVCAVSTDEETCWALESTITPESAATQRFNLLLQCAA